MYLAKNKKWKKILIIYLSIARMLEIISKNMERNIYLGCYEHLL
jgi:hypothetical protein